MGKKKHKSSETTTAQEKKKNNIYFVIAGTIAATVIVLAVTGRLPFPGTQETGKSFQIKGGETRPVIDPSQFTGQTRAAYEAAKKYPQVLDQLFCYCYCDEPPFHHVSLLSCFVDRHGAG